MPGLSFYDKQHIQKVAAQQAVIANIFNQFILSVSPYLRKWSDAGKNNVWISNQGIESAVDRELLNLESMLYANISAFQKDGSGTAQEGFSGGLRVKHTTPTLLRPESLVNQGFYHL